MFCTIQFDKQLIMKADNDKNIIKNKSEMKINLIKEKYYEAQDIFGEIGLGAFKGSETYIYDLDGNLIEERILDSDNKTIESTTYKYEHGKLMEEVFIDYTDASNNYTLKMEYDSFGNIVDKKEIIENGKIKSCTKFNYDSSQNLIDETSFNGKGEITSKYLFKYDDKNLLIKSNCYDSTGFLLHSKTYEHSGRMIKIIEYDKKGDIIIRINYHNYKKNIINDEIIHTGHARASDHNIWFTKGWLISGKYSVNHKETWAYTEKNLLLSYEKYYKNDITEIMNYKYEYDDYDEWEKKTHFRNEIPIRITIRDIYLT